MSSTIDAKCDICSRPIFKNGHFIMLPEIVEAWCHACFVKYEPSEDKIFRPETDSWVCGTEVHE